jgi:hypothetical protein
MNYSVYFVGIEVLRMVEMASLGANRHLGWA